MAILRKNIRNIFTVVLVVAVMGMLLLVLSMNAKAEASEVIETGKTVVSNFIC